MDDAVWSFADPVPVGSYAGNTVEPAIVWPPWLPAYDPTGTGLSLSDLDDSPRLQAAVDRAARQTAHWVAPGTYEAARCWPLSAYSKMERGLWHDWIDRVTRPAATVRFRTWYAGLHWSWDARSGMWPGRSERDCRMRAEWVERTYEVDKINARLATLYADPPQVDRMRTWHSNIVEFKKQETRYADDTEAR